MKTITAKTKMRELGEVTLLTTLNNENVMDMVRKFSIPDRIGYIKATHNNKISIGQIMDIWDIRTDRALIETTLKLFLKNDRYKRLVFALCYRKVERLPMIDFLLLVANTEDLGTKTAQLFETLKREPKDERKKAIYAKYKGNKFDFIKRFCDIAPAYTYDEAYNVPWPTVFMAFQAKVQQDDIEMELSELQNNDLKNKHK